MMYQQCQLEYISYGNRGSDTVTDNLDTKCNYSHLGYSD